MPFGGLLTVAIIGAAGQGISAGVNAHAASSAADKQVAASEQAAQATREASANSLAFQKQQWQQSQSNAEPWVAYGRGAVTTLGDLMGIKPIPTTGGAPPTTGPIPTNPDGSQVGSGIPWDQGSSRPSSAPPGYHWDDQFAMFQPDKPPTLGGQYGQSSTPTAPPPTAGAPQPPPASSAAVAPPPVAVASKIVRITWPDGSQAQVPSDQLNQYKSMGAEVAS